MAINFPASPTEGQVHNVSPGNSFVYLSSRWAPAPMTTALPKNYLVNPAMQISQLNGTTATATAINIYALDQWRVTGSGTAKPVYTIQQLALDTPFGFPYRMRCTYTTQASGTTASGQLSQPIEGLRVADLQFGTANALQIVVRLGFRASVAGSYNLIIASISGGRAYPTLITVAAGQVNTDLYFTFVIPGDTFGTWAKDATQGMEFIVNTVSSASVVSAWLGGLNAWQGANAGGPSAGTQTLNAVFDIFDCGIYADPYKTGVAPPFQLPVYAHELRRCQRYWYRQNTLRGGVSSGGGGTGIQRMGATHPAIMRVPPAASIVGVPKMWDASISSNMSTITGQYSTEQVAELDINGATAQNIGRGCVQYVSAATDYVAMNARM